MKIEKIDFKIFWFRFDVGFQIIQCLWHMIVEKRLYVPKQAKFNLKLMQSWKLPSSLMLHLCRFKKIKKMQWCNSFSLKLACLGKPINKYHNDSNLRIVEARYAYLNLLLNISFNHFCTVLAEWGYATLAENQISLSIS